MMFRMTMDEQRSDIHLPVRRAEVDPRLGSVDPAEEQVRKPLGRWRMPSILFWIVILAIVAMAVWLHPSPGKGPGDNTFLFSRGRWKSGSAMAPRAVLDRVMWSSLTTSQARATRRARWEFRGSVPPWRWAPNAGPALSTDEGTHGTSATLLF